ncbi:MAG: beta-galactosidase [Oscillospiraceae bacterium]|nr:beta-galactosidase [Oscillospiraceae bacterium]
MKLEVKGDKLYLDGNIFTLKSGAVHYFRIHPSQWRDRLMKLKECGLNTVETYIAWNLFEPRQNEFSSRGIADFEKFIDIAAELGLYAIVRPGPYICAEWEMGGLPSWLLNIDGIKLRHYNEKFMRYAGRYLNRVIDMLKPRFSTAGGNIIAIQAENEFGGLNEPDDEYLNAIYDIYIAAGVDILIFTSDGVWNEKHLAWGSIERALACANFGSDPENAFAKVEELRPGTPKVCMELWNGWFDQWGAPHHTREPREVIDVVKTILDAGGHFNLYMFCGGTNFGFMNGSNGNGVFEPCITSYDYGAPLDESGRITPQYTMLKKLLTGSEEVSFRQDAPKAYGGVRGFRRFGMLQNSDKLGRRFKNTKRMCMEECGQLYGYILYEADISGMSGIVDIGEPRDRAMIYADGVLIGEYERGREYTLVEVSGAEKIQILIENMGRVNYGPWIFDKKGLIQNLKIGECEVDFYDITCYDTENIPDEMTESGNDGMPAVYRADFIVNGAADTYLLPCGFTKGVAFVNGFNLGRYWNIGPQQTLYVPAGVLKEGVNRLEISDLYGCENPEAEFVSEPVTDRPVSGNRRIFE